MGQHSKPLIGTHEVRVIAIGDAVYCLRDDGETVDLTDERNFAQLLRGDWPEADEGGDSDY